MKTLKLTGLATYAGPRVKNNIVRRNEVVTVDDEQAEAMLEGHEYGLEGKVDHWTDVSNDPDVVVNHLCASVPFVSTTQVVGKLIASTDPVEEQPDTTEHKEEQADVQEQPKEAESHAAAPKKTQRVGRKNHA